MAIPRKPKQKASPDTRIKRVIKNNKNQKKPNRRLTSFLAVLMLLGITSLVISFAWISFLFIFQPQKVVWINKVLPQWAQIKLSKGDSPQTWTQIADDLSKQGLQKGETLALNNADTFLLPVYRQRTSCQSDCQEIVELRVYQQANDLEFQSTEKHYQLTTQVAISGPEESFVIAPLVNATNDNPGSSISLPITEIKRLDGAITSEGIWYYLLGRRQEGTYNINYGHILYYNPNRYHIQQLISWTSPTGELPQWQQVTGNNNKELVINQTIGLEPQLQVYQTKSVKTFLNPIELNEITLKPPAFKNSAYEKALSIARSGLWTPAYDWLKFITKNKKNIPALAKAQIDAQIDLIRLHSQISKAQADRTWASPGQQILANLIDGRWGKALELFKAEPPQNSFEIGALLKADSGRLWSRVEAALQVNSDRPEVQAWGALILATQYGDARAYSWLKEQFKDKQVTIAEIQSLLKQLKGETVTQSLPTATHTSKIIGSAQNFNQPLKLNEWLQFDSTTNTTTKWYEIKVSAFHDGKNWLYAPFTNLKLPQKAPEKFLRSTLGLDNDALLQIAIWQSNNEQQSINATIKAAQLNNGVLRLLAQPNDTLVSISNLQNRPQALATTTSALEWVQTNPTTLAQMQSQDPPRANTILKSVWQVVQAYNKSKRPDNASTQQIRQNVGQWPIQEIDITGNGKPEIVLTVSAETLASLQSSKKYSRPRTLIFSDNASIIYTDFGENAEQSLTAIANLTQTNLPSLLIQNANGYTLKRWSQKNQRFE